MNEPRSDVPALRIELQNSAAVSATGNYVLYWMIANRRTNWNFAFERAVDWAVELARPLIVFEALRCGYPWASDRLHRFVLDGMRDNRDRLADTSVAYYPYIEPRPDADKGLLAALAAQAAVVVTDTFPSFFLPRMLKAAARGVPVRFEAVDSNGLLPLGATDQTFPTAYAFRRFLQKNLTPHLSVLPKADPLRKIELPKATLPADVLRRWPAASEKLLSGDVAHLATLPIDHNVGIAPIAGGAAAASKALRKLLSTKLEKYPEDRNLPDVDGSSGLSPYLHFGHVSAHEVFAQIMRREKWSPEQVASKATGSRSGWWNVSDAAEAFLDQLITWRELGYNMSSHRADYDQYESLPEWAQKSLAKHARDHRPTVYTLEEFAQCQTHDPLWNAAQNQLLSEGRLHNYLRMLWGKKILEWTESPQEALAVMVELNNRYALDGRNPNSYSGIFWTLGRYDRPWGPERPIFGTVRYMSSENTARKMSVTGYLRKYLPQEEVFRLKNDR